MKIKLLMAAALSLCLLLAGCDQTRRTPPPNQPEASQPAGTGEGQEGATVDENQSMETDETDTPAFVKAQIGDAYVYALDNLGNLYRYNILESSMEQVWGNILDFSVDLNGSLSVLQRDGKMQEYLRGEQLPNKHIDHKNAAAVSDSVLILKDGSLLHHNFQQDCWNEISLKAKKVSANFFEAAIIDTDNTLWVYDRATEQLTKIAENVIDCDCYHFSKYHYSTDVWYITEDGALHLMEESEQNRDENAVLPSTATAIAASHGYYLAQQEDETYIYGHYTSGEIKKEIDIKGIYADITDSAFVIIDKQSKLHLFIDFGESEITIEHPLG